MRKLTLLGGILLVCVTGISAMAQTAATPAKPAGNLARGKYLVNNVGMCSDCHTPMDKRGNLVRAKFLQGTPLMFKPTVPVPGWMEAAPGIAGLEWTDEEAITFFTTGKRPNGTMAAPPMPQFRFNKADAAAVTAYLKSLKK
ncbi:MAG TPA: cytochrome c [Terriglobales bacterium]|nr:cytochrome c [Terriglobales bacterium]